MRAPTQCTVTCVGPIYTSSWLVVPSKITSEFRRMYRADSRNLLYLKDLPFFSIERISILKVLSFYPFVVPSALPAQDALPNLRPCSILMARSQFSPGTGRANCCSLRSSPTAPALAGRRSKSAQYHDRQERQSEQLRGLRHG
jgi:hypothetical protein